jgi:hypothetical protein
MPVPLTRFVGRERERAEVARLVAENRFVTLVGAGGVGKTRLAIEVAARLAASFGDGTDLIDLSAVTDPALLTGAVARGLGLEERAGTGLEERMLRVLRGQHRLGQPIRSSERSPALGRANSPVRVVPGQLGKHHRSFGIKRI